MCAVLLACFASLNQAVSRRGIHTPVHLFEIIIIFSLEVFVGANFSNAPPTEFEATPTIPFSVRRLSKFTSFKHQPRSELRMLSATNKTTNNHNNFGSNGGRFGSKIGNNGGVGGNAWSTGGNYGSKIGIDGSIGGNAWSNDHRVGGNKMNDSSFGSKIGNDGNIVNSSDNAWSNGGSCAGNVSGNLFINRTINFSTPRSSFGIQPPPPVAVRQTLISDRFNLNHLK